MKKMLRALILGLGLPGIGCGEGEQEEAICPRYQTVLEETFGRDDNWEINHERGYCGNFSGYNSLTEGCYSPSPVCPGDEKEGYVLSGITATLIKTFSVPASLALDRIVLVGNAYGRNVKLGIQIEDFEPVEISNLNEEHDCLENIIDFPQNYEQRHAITGDGEFYFKISLLEGSSAPMMPICTYSCVCESKPCSRQLDDISEHTRSNGYYGLSKIMFQQCGDGL